MSQTLQVLLHLIHRLRRAPRPWDHRSVLQTLSLPRLIPDQYPLLADELCLSPDLRIRGIVVALLHFFVVPVACQFVFLGFQECQFFSDVRVDEISDVATVDDFGLFVVFFFFWEEIVLLEIHAVDAGATVFGFDVPFQPWSVRIV